MIKSNNQGFVLFSMLLFLQIFSMLELHSYTALVLMQKLNEKGVQYTQMYSYANYLLPSLQSQILSSDHLCLVPPMTVKELMRKRLLWWQQFGCDGNFDNFKYYYVIEALGVDSCALISNADGLDLVADYYRLSLLLVSQVNNQAKILFQTTFVKKCGRTEQCADISHRVLEGQQMWRELDIF